MFTCVHIPLQGTGVCVQQDIVETVDHILFIVIADPDSFGAGQRAGFPDRRLIVCRLVRVIAKGADIAVIRCGADIERSVQDVFLPDGGFDIPRCSKVDIASFRMDSTVLTASAISLPSCAVPIRIEAKFPS